MVNPFELFKTNYSFFKYLEKQNLFKPPTVPVVEGKQIVESASMEHNLEIDSNQHLLAIMDIHFQLKFFSKRPEFFRKRLNIYINLSSLRVSDIL